MNNPHDDAQRRPSTQEPGVDPAPSTGRPGLLVSEHPIEQWGRELREAGWREVRLNVWQAPNGGLFRGPYGAWTALHAGHGEP